MSIQVVGQAGTGILGAAVAGGALVVGEKLIYGMPIDMSAAYRFGESAVSHGLSDLATSWVSGYLYNMSPMLASYEKLLVQPVISGAIYAGADKYLNYDHSSTMYKFLLQVGASAVSNYGTGPLRTMLKM
jgi:hypothetical protein